MQKIHINVDVGEGLQNEAVILPHISACNIACGAHAGDKQTILNILALAKTYNVAVGAHPSYPDKANFGRKIMQITDEDLYESLVHQLQLFKKLATHKNVKINHVKPHGALYNVITKDEKMAQLVVNAIENSIGNTTIFVPYNSVIEQVAIQKGLKVYYEVFADRNYNTDLSLVDRTQKNAILTNIESIKNHIDVLLQEKVKTISGNFATIKADTFCVHGDHPNATELIQYLSKNYQIEKAFDTN